MYHAIAHNTKREARTLVSLILEGGHTISVHDGEVWSLKKSKDANAIIDAMGETESESLRVRNAQNEIIGWFYLIYTNGRGELIADYTDNKWCNAIARQFSTIHPTR